MGPFANFARLPGIVVNTVEKRIVVNREERRERKLNAFILFKYLEQRIKINFPDQSQSVL